MNVDNLAQRLVNYGIIDAPAAQKMSKYCKSLQAYDYIMGLGIAAIVLSVVFVIAANWQRIPYSLKISIHALANGVVAVMLFLLYKTGRRHTARFKTLMWLLAVLTLTFIMLVNQVFRTHWPAWKTIAFWFLLMAPFVVAFAGKFQKFRDRLLSLFISLVAFTPGAASKYADKFAGKYVEKYLAKHIPSFDAAKSLPREKIADKLRPFFLVLCLLWPVLGVFAFAAGEQVARPMRFVMRIPIESWDQKTPFYGDYLRFRFYGSDAPDNKYHDYYIPGGKVEIDKVFSHPEGHMMTMEVYILNGEVLSYDMLYIDNMPWQRFNDIQYEKCRERMGGDC